MWKHSGKTTTTTTTIRYNCIIITSVFLSFPKHLEQLVRLIRRTTKSQIKATGWILLRYPVMLQYWKWILLEAQGFSDVQSHSSMAPGQGILPWTSILRLWEHCLHGWKKAMCLHRCFKLLAHRSSCTEPHHRLLCHGPYTFCISLPFDTEMKAGRRARRLAWSV